MTLMLSLTTVVMIETIFLKLLTDSKRPTPSWATKFSNFLSNNFIMKFFIDSPFEELETDKKKEIALTSAVVGEASVEAGAVEVPKSDWTIFSRFVDRTLFIALIAAFFIAGFKI